MSGPNFASLLELGMQLASMSGQFVMNYNAVKQTLSTTELEQLQPILDQIHATNLLLSQQIDDAAAQAEKA